MYGCGPASLRQLQWRWRRAIKTAILLLACLCASLTCSYAYAHAKNTHRDNWNALARITTDRMESLDDRILASPTALQFFLANMSLTALAYAYHSSNCGDGFQNAILVSSVVSGLLLALSLDLGIILGVFGLGPWILLLGLVISDFFHLTCVRRRRYVELESEPEYGIEKAFKLPETPDPAQPRDGDTRHSPLAVCAWDWNRNQEIQAMVDEGVVHNQETQMEREIRNRENRADRTRNREIRAMVDGAVDISRETQVKRETRNREILVRDGSW
jgi:hypothetical protein